jgi:hypothetical protein
MLPGIYGIFHLVTKLLPKKGNLCAGIYDHIGMQFITNDIFSAILSPLFLANYEAGLIIRTIGALSVHQA